MQREELRQARELLGLSHEDAGGLVGKTGSWVRQCEAGSFGSRSDAKESLRGYIRALHALAIERSIDIGIPAESKQPEILLVPDVFTPKPLRGAA